MLPPAFQAQFLSAAEPDFGLHRVGAGEAPGKQMARRMGCPETVVLEVAVDVVDVHVPSQGLQINDSPEGTVRLHADGNAETGRQHTAIPEFRVLIRGGPRSGSPAGHGNNQKQKNGKTGDKTAHDAHSFPASG